MSDRLKRLIIVFAVLAGLWILIKIWVAIYPDWLWFSVLNYLPIYKKILGTKILMGVTFTSILLIVVLGNLYLIRRLAPRPFNLNVVEAIPIGGQIDFDFRKYLYIVLAFILGGFCILLGYTTTDKWEMFLRYFNSVDFGINDPLFSKDVGYYVFQMPFEKFLCGWLFGLFFMLTLFTAVMYFFHGAILSERNQFEPPFAVRAHLFTMIAVALLLRAWRYRFLMYDLLYSTNSPAVKFGAGFAEAHARLPVLWIMLVLCIVLALVFLIGIFRRRHVLFLVGASFALLFFAGVLGRIYPGVVQQFRVKPNEKEKELKYIKYNVDFTRKAYNLTDKEIVTKSYETKGELTLDAINQERNAPVMENIRLWDWRPLRRVYQEIEKLRLQYEYVDVDIDRYTVDGHIRQVMLSARELDYDNLTESDKSWVRRTFLYTHGYGVSMSPVKEIEDGLPQMYIEKIPLLTYANAQEWGEGLSSAPDVPGPRIYYGERTDYYVIVNPKSSKPSEFDYPAEEGQYKENSYQGNGGVQLSSWLRKFAYALKLGGRKYGGKTFIEYNILLAQEITPDSRVLYDRKIKERVKNIAPFLKYDEDPYLVISEGRLFWILDAYTTTSLYPYSERMEDVFRELVVEMRGRRSGQRVLRRGIPWGNYIRNSVKVVIDAYNGNVDFYLMQNDEFPIAECYNKIFDNLFKSFEEMPAELKRHIRYPETMFWIQAHKYQYYHMEDPTTFYMAEDLWKMGKEVYDNTEQQRVEPAAPAAPISRFARVPPPAPKATGNIQPMEPYYVILMLPGEEKAEFLLILPFTPARNEKVMSAWLAARCDVESGEYGKLLLYQFPKGAGSIPSPMRVEDIISIDTEISKNFTLWDQRGSRVLRGNLLVIPMNNSLLYVEPIYIQAEQEDAIPKLQSVIIGYENYVVMGDNLQDALIKMFGSGAETAPLPEATSFTEVDEVPTTTTPEVTTTEGASIQTLATQAGRQYDQAQAALRAGDLEEFGAKMKEFESTFKLLLEKTNQLP